MSDTPRSSLLAPAYHSVEKRYLSIPLPELVLVVGNSFTAATRMESSSVRRLRRRVIRKSASSAFPKASRHFRPPVSLHGASCLGSGIWVFFFFLLACKRTHSHSAAITHLCVCCLQKRQQCDSNSYLLSPAMTLNEGKMCFAHHADFFFSCLAKAFHFLPRWRFMQRDKLLPIIITVNLFVCPSIHLHWADNCLTFAATCILLGCPIGCLANVSASRSRCFCHCFFLLVMLHSLASSFRLPKRSLWSWQSYIWMGFLVSGHCLLSFFQAFASLCEAMSHYFSRLSVLALPPSCGP